MLSRPPHATKLPDGAYAHVITQLDRSGIACIYKIQPSKWLQAIRITYSALPNDCLLNGIPHSESKVPCWSVIGWFIAGKSPEHNVANWLHNTNIARFWSKPTSHCFKWGHVTPKNKCSLHINSFHTWLKSFLAFSKLCGCCVNHNCSTIKAKNATSVNVNCWYWLLIVTGFPLKSQDTNSGLFQNLSGPEIPKNQYLFLYRFGPWPMNLTAKQDILKLKMQWNWKFNSKICFIGA